MPEQLGIRYFITFSINYTVLMTPEVRTRHRALSTCIIGQVSRESIHADSSLYFLVGNNICSSPVMFFFVYKWNHRY